MIEIIPTFFLLKTLICGVLVALMIYIFLDGERGIAGIFALCLIMLAVVFLDKE